MFGAMWPMAITKKIIFLFLIVHAFAQAQTDFYFEIKFTDKGNLYSTQAPEIYLSESSIQKKNKRGIPVDVSDFPIDSNYIKDVKNLGGNVVKSSKWRNSVLIKTDDTSNITNLRALPVVASATYFTLLPQGVLKTNAANKLEREVDWYQQNYLEGITQIAMMNGHFLHERGFKGEGMDIAVFDAGFPDVLPVINELKLSNQIKSTYDFVDGDEYVYEKFQHGTMVLSVLGAHDTYFSGVAPNANYHLFITEDTQSESLLEEYNWLMAAERADSIGVDVVNSSLGYTTFDDIATNHTYFDMDGKTTLVTQAANMLARKGVFVVSSAGNDGANLWHYIAAPADGDSVLAVGAVNKDRVYASFSSTGPSADGDVKPNVTAMGDGAVIGYNSMYLKSGGTSFSGPMVAGLVACYWQSSPSISNLQLKSKIELNASQAAQPDSLLGYGIPDFMKMFMKEKSSDEYVYGQSYLMSLRNSIFTDYVGIELYSATQQKVRFQLLDMNGRLVGDQTKEVQENQYLIFGFEDLQNLSSGMYVLMVFGENGEWDRYKVVKR